MERSRLYPWAVRATWAILPFAAGPALAAALDHRSHAVRGVASVGLWGAWALVLGATLVMHPVALTLLRLGTPAAVVAAGSSLTGAADVAGLAALAATMGAVVLAFLPETGVLFVNGPAYPNERRYPLRPPGPLLLGPIPVAWAVTVGGPAAGALLLASRQWLAGALVVVVGGVCGFLGGRALHGLARRWVVFVPAGLVLHDPMSLADPVLFPRPLMAGVDLAPADTDALDLTQRAPGLAVEVQLKEETSLVLTKPGHRAGLPVRARGVLFTPTRPGRVLAEARRRRLPSAASTPSGPA